jgi:hypothetical protein
MAQVDFGEAEVIIAGEQLTAQIFCLRMCYSKQSFVCLWHNRNGSPALSMKILAY